MSRRFYAAAAVCSAVSGATTLGLIFLPRLATPRLWIGVGHPLLVLVAAIAVAALKLRSATAAATTGLAFFIAWAILELAQQSIVLVSVSRGFGMAPIQPVTDGLFFAILIVFIVADVLYGIATARGRGLERVVSIFFFVAAGLGGISWMGSFGPGSVFPGLMAVLYPATQPIARVLTGVWIWRAGRNGTASG